METKEEVKNEEITLKGKVRAGYADLPEVIISKIGDKPVARFTIYSKHETDGNLITPCIAWDTNIPKVDKLIKDDIVEIKGYYGKEFTTKQGETKRDFIIKECQRLNMSLKGNIGKGFGDNPEIVIKEVNGKKVANFSICVNDNTNEKKWYNCQVWGDKIKEVENYKQGDFVELRGVFGKEYKNQKQELKQDFIVNSSNVIISAKERIQNKAAESFNEIDKPLVDAIRKGDFKAVEQALQNGANIDSISPEHYKNLSEKTKEVIENTIDKFCLEKEDQGEKKKNSLSI